MYVRVTTIHSKGGANATRDYSAAIAEALPRVTAQAGCLGGLVVADPLHGTHHTVVFWATVEALIESSGFAEMINDHIVEEIDAFADATVVQVLDVVGVDLARVAVAAQSLHEGVEFPLVDPN